MRVSKWLRSAAVVLLAGAAGTVGTGSAASAADQRSEPHEVHSSFGYSWATDPIGVRATHSIGSNGAFSSSDHVWAPTLYPGGVACFEMSTVHHSDGTIHLTPFDWCGEDSWHDGMVVDDAFRNAYVRNAQYTISIERTDAASNAWTAYLLNRNTGRWDQVYTLSGVHRGNPSGGWDFFEVISSVTSDTEQGDYCARMAGRTFSTTGLRFNLGNGWVPGTSSNMNTIGSDDPADYACPGLTLRRPTPDSWTVTDTA